CPRTSSRKPRSTRCAKIPHRRSEPAAFACRNGIRKRLWRSLPIPPTTVGERDWIGLSGVYRRTSRPRCRSFSVETQISLTHVVHAYPTTDPRGSQLPFDSVRASRSLDSLGWIRGVNGIRSKNGKELAFTLIIPTSSKNRVRMGPLIQEQLRRMGIRVQLEQLEKSTESERESRGAFDAALGSWTSGSSPDGINGGWTTSRIGTYGVNYGGYSNPRSDVLLDSALRAETAQARDIFSRAFAVINEDAPAVWLYEPRKIMGIDRRLRTAVMRPAAWWFALADWYIPPADRLPRDRIPVRR